MPADANVSWPGWRMASAISSFTDVTGTDGWQTTIFGPAAASEMNVKSFSVSKGSFAYKLGAMACVLGAIPSV